MNFIKTNIENISVNETGNVFNTKSKKLLKITSRGYFCNDGKFYNLPKLMLLTFKNIEIKTGRINFKDGNKQNFHIENLEYITKLNKILPPNEKDILRVIGFYFKIDESFNVKDLFLYRSYMMNILEQKQFFKKCKDDHNIDVFRRYFSWDMPNYITLAKNNNISVSDAKRTVYFFMNKLIKMCEAEKTILTQIYSE